MLHSLARLNKAKLTSIPRRCNAWHKGRCQHSLEDHWAYLVTYSRTVASYFSGSVLY